MGEVYRARDTRLGREVAVKVLSPHLSENPEMRVRFEREARIASALAHPHICVLHDVGHHDGTDFLVMELLEGETLAQRLARGPLSIPEVFRIGIQVADALARAHRAGVVHRDLKPGNVMLTSGGAKLMDFGLARGSLPGNTSGPAPTLEAPLTAHGTFVGTFQYMAPEQLEGLEADARSDVWALGCVLYEMATGKRAYDGASPASVISAILKDEPRALAELVPLAPLLLDGLVRACLAKDPERRWQNAQDIALVLAEGNREQGPAESAAATPSPAERRLTLTAAHVRHLAERNPKLVGRSFAYVDNRADSDTLVVLLHGVGADTSRFEAYLRLTRRRAVAVTLIGYERGEVFRPVLSVDDHSRLLRILLAELVNEIRPRRIALVGHSAGADQWLRMVHAEPGAGVPVDALLCLAPNVSLETCFATRLYARIDPSDPGGTLALLKSLGQNIESLETWLVVQGYLSQTFLKLGSDLAPIRRYAAELIAPFASPGDPLADWYRAARRAIRRVRLVFSNEEALAAEELLARHLESDVLGPQFSEESFVIERAQHMQLLEPERIERHLEQMLAD
jgi:pimeloyl-ACP methyl ester carboxylesterase